MNVHRILLVDDDATSLKLLKAAFESTDYSIYTAVDGREALSVLEKEQINLVVTDILMPNVDGYYLCFKIRSSPHLKDVAIIVYSGTFTKEGEEKVAKGMGADVFIRKPASLKHLLDVANKLLLNPQDHPLPAVGTTFEILQKYSAELIDKLEKRNQALEGTKQNLEKIVLERTKKLDSANEELKAINDELQAANEEILASNEELRATNEELTALNDQLTLAAETIQKQSEIIINQKEEALKRSEQSLRVIFSNTIEAIVVLDTEGKILMFNDSLEKFIEIMTGKKPIIGMYVWDMTVPERRITSIELFNRALQGETIETEAIMQSTEERIVHLLRYTPVFIDNQITYVTIISVDITEKKRQENLLKESERNLQAIFQNTNDAFTLLDTELNIIAFNKKNERMVAQLTGGKLEKGKNLLKTIPSERKKPFEEIIAKVKERGNINYTTKYHSEQGEKWFDVDIAAVNDENGKISGYCLTSRDSTVIKQTEEEILRLNKSLLNFQQAIFTSSMASLTDAEGTIIYVNDNTLAVNGYSREEFLGQNFRILNSGYHPKSFWMNMWQTISSGKTWNGRICNRAKSGKLFWVNAFIIPFMNEENKAYQYLTIRHDITKQKEAEDELIQNRILLEESSAIAKIGSWILDKSTGKMSVSKEMLSLFEVTEAELVDAPQNLYKHVHPADRHKIMSNEELLKSTDIVMHTEYRLLKSEGSLVWIYQKADLTKVINNLQKIVGIVQDITERKITEEALLEYNERYEILSKATNDAIWDLNLLSDTIIWNQSFFSIFGYGAQDIEYTGKWWRNKIHPDDYDRTIKNFGSAIINLQTHWTDYYRMLCANGEYKHVHNRCYILYEQNKPIRAIGSLQDITERVETMQEIEKLSLVASTTKNAVMILNKNGTIEWVNESFNTLTGYELSEIKDKSPAFLYGPESDPETIKRISKKTQNKEFVSEELVNYTKNGSKYWAKLDIVPVFDTENQLINYISIQSDISEIKEYERSITSIARELSSLIENANVPIFGIDCFGNVNEWNLVAAELTGYSRSSLIGIKWDTIPLFYSGKKQINEMSSEAMKGLSSTNVEVPISAYDGIGLILLLSASPRRNNLNEVIGIIFVGQNITELTEYRHNLEKKVADRTQELNVALSKEKELVQLKSQFVSIASHEFRTPLTSIKLAAGFIKKYKEKISFEVIDKKLESIEKQVENMTYLLDDVLLIGKAEAGKLPVIKKELDIIQFIQNISTEVQKNNGGTHRIELHHNLSSHILITDEKLLRNIFINLLTNAIKFSPDANRVTITIYEREDMMCFNIKDEGVGIPENDIKNLFEPFFRGGNVTSIQGTGLGLSIIKKALDLLNGKISLQSTVGKGTEIKIELPVA